MLDYDINLPNDVSYEILNNLQTDIGTSEVIINFFTPNYYEEIPSKSYFLTVKEQPYEIIYQDIVLSDNDTIIFPSNKKSVNIFHDIELIGYEQLVISTNKDDIDIVSNGIINLNYGDNIYYYFLKQKDKYLCYKINHYRIPLYQISFVIDDDVEIYDNALNKLENIEEDFNIFKNNCLILIHQILT